MSLLNRQNFPEERERERERERDRKYDDTFGAMQFFLTAVDDESMDQPVYMWSDFVFLTAMYML